MPQILYRFGFNPDEPTDHITAPKPTHEATRIDILWASWCDLIYITTQADNTRSIIYTGTSLNATQQQEFLSPSSTINQALANPGCNLGFFGSAMHDGVRGYICNSKISIFSTPAEEAEVGTQSHDNWTWAAPSPLAEVKMSSNDSLLIAHRADSHGPGSISAIPTLQSLKDYCTDTCTIRSPLASIRPVQLATNATTATALDQDGRVYTRTIDPRYPTCLGRPYIGTSTFEPVPYLSETRITKIASGGYMTAAISDDGELFLWGQVNPGTEEQLDVLHRLDYNANTAVRKGTVIWGDSVQDEDVKCLNIHIDRENATAYDVAIGFGHILVAAKGEAGKHVVFVAGCGGEGQSGTGRTHDFLQEFEEVVALRGKRAIQLAAAGWSSFLVTDE